VLKIWRKHLADPAGEPTALPLPDPLDGGEGTDCLLGLDSSAES